MKGLNHDQITFGTLSAFCTWRRKLPVPYIFLNYARRRKRKRQTNFFLTFSPHGLASRAF